ncbi:MAG TPA: secretin and TonB N-terminal domain-containing protein [bacterium]|jgi:type II secretory pathway component GspD/PulD (secretin)|nr:secretin and TonB N-terminal domain-containing protein [bacterium]
MSATGLRTIRRLTFLILAAALIITGWPARPAAAAQVLVTSVGVKVFPGVLQIAITGSGSLRFRTSTMSSPAHRLLIDIPGARLDGSVPAVQAVNKGSVLRVRAAQFETAPPVVRIVIDLSAPTSWTVTAVTPQVLAARLPIATTAAAKPVTAGAEAAANTTGRSVAQAPAPTPTPIPPVNGGRVTITLELRNAELADALSALAKLCGFNIVTDASVKGTITLRLVDVTCDEALRFILDANNLGFRRVGRNLIIMAAEKLAPPPEAPEAVIYSIGFADVDKVRAAIAASVPGVRVAVDTRANVLIVFGTPAQQEQVQKILAALDIQIPQMVVETRVVDIGTNVLRDLGLNFGTTGGILGMPVGGVVTITGVFPSNFTIGVTGSWFPGFGVFLTALVREGKARVLSAPRVAVVDGNKASVNLGEEVPIPQVDANGRITFTFKPIGVVLEITPRLNKDNIITVAVAPEVSSVIEFLQTPAGPVPRIATRKANTTIQVRSGESIVIAGMISAQERVTTVKVPFLGDIPIIGSLFRRTTTDRSESEVIFIITPTVVGAGGP